MTWTSLAASVGSLPLVLAGPMLRKVTDTSVTVWFALKAAATVNLTVSGPAGVLLTGSEPTTPIGANLHIVAVTANKLATKTTPPLSPGFVYTYDVAFDVPSLGKSLNLAAATTPAGGKPADLAFAPFTSPSFCMPPSDITKLRLIHGSCRHPTGNNGPDCLAMLADLIGQAPNDPDHRPHQLMMGGDQIYADDVGGGLLLALSDAADTLLWPQNDPELLPLPAGNKPGSGTKIPPYSRARLAEDSGFTSDSASCHLLTLGEYLCMYLFVWSDVLWSPKTIPTPAQVLAAAASPPPFTVQYAVLSTPILNDKTIQDELDASAVFSSTLPKVRKALANIPTYMILDDHDVTDDFNMTRDFLNTVYADGSTGFRVIQNAMIAYALCQHWGNAPEQFFTADTAPANAVLKGPLPLPGRDLLNKLAAVKGGTTYAAALPAIRLIVGVHNAKEMNGPPTGAVTAGQESWLSAYHDVTGSLTYNYTVESHTHQIIVTDTRTWRAFKPAMTNKPPIDNQPAVEHPELLTKDQINRQILQAPDTAGRALIVVVSTNAPPVPGIRFSAEHPTLTKVVSYFKTSTHDTHPDIFEAWEPGYRPFDRLMGAICTRVQLTGTPPNQIHSGGAVILSGDVHSSFATRLMIQGANPLLPDFPAAEPVNAVLVQCVSSSFRNQTGTTIDQAKEGYSYPGAGLIHYEPGPQGFVGWNNIPPPGGIIGTDGMQKALKVTDNRRTFFLPQLVNDGSNPGVPVVKPDFRYRLDYLKATKENSIPLNFAGTKMPSMPTDLSQITYQQRIDTFISITANYNHYSGGDATDVTMVGVNNISELTYGSDGTISHTARWYRPAPAKADPDTGRQDLPDTSSPMLTTWQVSLSPNTPSPGDKGSINNLLDVFPLNWVKP